METLALLQAGGEGRRADPPEAGRKKPAPAGRRGVRRRIQTPRHERVRRIAARAAQQARRGYAAGLVVRVHPRYLPGLRGRGNSAHGDAGRRASGDECHSRLRT